MKRLTKAESEAIFVQQILSAGIKQWCKTYERGNWYYCFWLLSGEIRYWTNMSEPNQVILGILKEAEGGK